MNGLQDIKERYSSLQHLRSLVKCRCWTGQVHWLAGDQQRQTRSRCIDSTTPPTHKWNNFYFFLSALATFHAEWLLRVRSIDPIPE